MPVNHILKLQNGQQLGYLEMGQASGPVCLFFHGFPGSSRQVLMIEKNSILDQFRVIAVDRPGFGDSTYANDGRISEVVDAVTELLDFLKVDRFHIIGVSGGSPASYMTADRLRKRVLSLTVISGLGPLHETEIFKAMHPVLQWGMRMCKVSPFMASKILSKLHGQMQANKPIKRENLLKLMPAEDADIMLDQNIRDVFRGSMGHAFKLGTKGPGREIGVFQQDWGIRDWNFPFPVYLWHGLKDPLVPPSHSEFMARKIPHAKLNMMPEEGHYSLAVKRIDLVLNRIQQG